MSAFCIWNPSSSRSARCGSSICCRSSSSSPRRRVKLPPLLIWAVAALLETAHIATGWTVIDEFCARFVYFYSGYLLRRLCVRAVGSRPGAAVLALAGLALWALVNGGLVEFGFSEWPLVSLVLGLAGACAIVTIGTLLARMRWLDFLRFCGEHSIVIYLAFFLPMAATRTLLLQAGPDPRHRHDLADRHHRRRARRAGDLARRAGGAAPISCSNGRPRSGSRRRRRGRRCRRRSR